MKDWFLIPLVLGFFLLGYPVMGQIDRFLDKTRSMHNTDPLRISLEDAVVSPTVVHRLNAFSREHPEVDLLFSCGQRQQLIRDLSMGKLDFALVYPTSEETPSNLKTQSVVLPYDAVKICGVPVRPIASGHKQVKLELISHISPDENEAAGQLGWFLNSAS